MISFQQNGTVARVWSKNQPLVAARAHESLPLPVKVVHRRALAIRRRVRKRSVAEIHAVSAIARECRRQEGLIHVAECNAVGGAEADVDGNANHSGSAHVKRKTDDVAHSPFAAERALAGAFVPLLQPSAVYSPRERVIASAFANVILARFEPLRAKAELRGAEKLDDLRLKVKRAPAQPDVSNKHGVDALELQLSRSGLDCGKPNSEQNFAAESL
jgi:hypothetical protein